MVVALAFAPSAASWTSWIPESTTPTVRLWWINTGGTSRIDSVTVDPYRRR